MARMAQTSSRMVTTGGGNGNGNSNNHGESSRRSPSSVQSTVHIPPMSTNDVNLLVYAYLAESSLDHSAFTLYSESRLAEYLHQTNDTNDSSNSSSTPPLPPTGQLVRILQKGLLYLQAEAKYRGEDLAANPPRLIGYTIPDALPLPPLPKSLPPPPPSPRAASPILQTNGNNKKKHAFTNGPSTTSAGPSGTKRKEQQKDSGEEQGGAGLSSTAQNMTKKQRLSVPIQSSTNNNEEESMPAPKANRKGKGKAVEDQGDSEMQDSSSSAAPSGSTAASKTPLARAVAAASATSKALPSAFSTKANSDLPSMRRSTSPVVSTGQPTSATTRNRPRSSSPSTSLRQSTNKAASSKTTESTPTLDATQSTSSSTLADTVTSSSSSTKPSLALPTFQRVLSASKLERPEPKKFIDKDMVIQLKGHTAPVTPCHWNPKVPAMLATGAGDSTSRFWDVPTAKQSEKPIEPITCKHSSGQRRSDVTAVEWNHDGTLLATGSEDGVARIWAPSGELHLVLPMHQRTIFSVKWNRKGTMLLTGSLDHSICLWELSFGKVKQQWTCHTESIMDLDWMSEEVFASCSQDKNINIHQIGRSSPAYRFKGHADEVNCIRFDPAKRFLASCSDDQEVRVWSLRPVKSTLGLKDDVKDEGAEEGEISTEGGSSSKAQTKDEQLSLHPFRDGEKPCMVLKGHKKEVHAVAWCPKKEASGEYKLLASASFDHTARIWDVTTGACIHIINRHTDMVYSLDWQPVLGEYLATGSNDKTMCITRVKDRELVYEYTHPGSVFEICWHPTRNQIAICGKPASVNVVNFDLPLA